MPIIWTRVTDQTTEGVMTSHFIRVGELPEGTRYVKFAINGVAQIGQDFKPDYAIGVVENAIATGKAPADSYGVIEVVVDRLEIIDGRKENLKKARAAKAAKEDSNEEYVVCPLCSETGEHDNGCPNPSLVLKKEVS